MRELVENKLGVHFRPSTHCSHVADLSANRIPGPAGDCCWHRVSRPSPARRARPGLTRWTEASAAGRISITALSHLAPAPLIEKSAASGRAQTTGMQMGNSVEKQAVAGSRANGVGWPAPALLGSDRRAEEHKPASRQPAADVVAFVRGADRAVAPAVGPWAAALSLENGPIPHHTADRGLRVLPTYLRHPEVSA